MSIKESIKKRKKTFISWSRHVVYFSRLLHFHGRRAIIVQGLKAKKHLRFFWQIWIFFCFVCACAWACACACACTAVSRDFTSSPTDSATRIKIYSLFFTTLTKYNFQKYVKHIIWLFVHVTRCLLVFDSFLGGFLISVYAYIHGCGEYGHPVVKCDELSLIINKLKYNKRLINKCVCRHILCFPVNLIDFKTYIHVAENTAPRRRSMLPI